jgi:hypothetical protein
MPDMVHTVMPTSYDLDMYLDIEPDARAMGTVRNIVAVIHAVTCAAVRRHR